MSFRLFLCTCWYVYKMYVYLMYIPSMWFAEYKNGLYHHILLNNLLSYICHKCDIHPGWGESWSPNVINIGADWCISHSFLVFKDRGIKIMKCSASSRGPKGRTASLHEGSHQGWYCDTICAVIFLWNRKEKRMPSTRPGGKFCLVKSTNCFLQLQELIKDYFLSLNKGPKTTSPW